jgi:putative membrane-bound dehydrogenase-like protein
MTSHAFRVAGILSVLATSSAALAQATPAPTTMNSLSNFEIPEGLEVRVWAQSPQMLNPTDIDVDARGRIWATEAVNYRETQKPQHALQHPDGDRVMILEDTDGDGVADSSKVFVQDKDLTAPLGIAVIGNKVIVSCSPNLIVYTDEDGDDKPDKKEILLKGFGGYDHDHGLHAVTGFLDGRWYFNVGNCGPHQVTDKSGWKLNSGSCYIHGNLNPDNTGNRKSDDGHVWVGGLALSMSADGKGLRVLGHNFRNCYEYALDSFGNMFQTDNDDDGNQGVRASWLMEGANMGFFSADGTRTWQADRRPGQNTQAAHWHQEDPGVLPYGDVTGAGGPTGDTVYEGGLLPDKYIGAFLACDAGRNRVSAHFPKPSGAGIVLQREDLIYSNPSAAQGEEADQRKWFRPSDVMVGTDGAVYVSDWYDPVVGGHDMRDKKGGGRILRIAPKGDKTLAPKIDLSTIDGQMAALNSPAINIRHQAADKLAAGGDEAVKKLLAAFGGGNAIQRARIIWVLSRCGDVGAQPSRRC